MSYMFQRIASAIFLLAIAASQIYFAIAAFDEKHPDGKTLVVAGGVAANSVLREKLSALCALTGFRFIAPPPALCTDNAAMIAWAGIERLRLGLTDNMDFAPRPRWPLEELRTAEV